jgi:16S rRNA (guanine966-N2)-methyltransferase
MALKIVGGRFGSMSLEAPPDASTTRPTTNRVREAMASSVLSAFDLSLEGAHVLDPFAGSGALALEFVSRGATRATLADANAGAMARIKRNVARLGLGREEVTVLRAKAETLAAQPTLANAPFNLVLLDPPYALRAQEVAALVTTLAATGKLAPRAVILYERAKNAAALAPLLTPAGFEELRTKHFGDTAYELLRYLPLQAPAPVEVFAAEKSAGKEAHVAKKRVEGAAEPPNTPL